METNKKIRLKIQFKKENLIRYNIMVSIQIKADSIFIERSIQLLYFIQMSWLYFHPQFCLVEYFHYLLKFIFFQCV